MKEVSPILSDQNRSSFTIQDYTESLGNNSTQMFFRKNEKTRWNTDAKTGLRRSPRKFSNYLSEIHIKIVFNEFSSNSALFLVSVSKGKIFCFVLGSSREGFWGFGKKNKGAIFLLQSSFNPLHRAFVFLPIYVQSSIRKVLR